MVDRTSSEEEMHWRQGLPGRTLAMLGVLLLLGACETRSISNSGYGRQFNPYFAGELTEFDVLGIEVAPHSDDADIVRTAGNYHRLVARKGAAVLLIQSGAPIPDDPMVQALTPYFTVVPFSGVPLARSVPATSMSAPAYAHALRLAAAKSGAEFILCYWGVLESTVDREPTKAVSWVPIIGSVVPDETQYMRIRLKVALVDVATGNWSMFVPDAFVDSSLSASLNRAGSDQGQVQALKEQAYKAAVAALVAKYAG
jgi:hypothetical protein